MRSSAVTAGQQGLASQYNNLRADAYGGAMLLAHQQSSPGMTLYVEPGVCYIGATRVIFAGGNSPSFSAPSAGNKRIDILTINSVGTLAIMQGTPTTGTPSAPAYPTDGTIVICEVYNVAGETSIKDATDGTNGYIYNDVRPYLIAIDPTVFVRTGGNVAENISGVKTFLSSPIVPDPTNNTDAANKEYVLSALHWNYISSASFSCTSSGGATTNTASVTIPSGANFALVVYNMQNGPAGAGYPYVPYDGVMLIAKNGPTSLFQSVVSVGPYNGSGIDRGVHTIWGTNLQIYLDGTNNNTYGSGTVYFYN